MSSPIYFSSRIQTYFPDAPMPVARVRKDWSGVLLALGAFVLVAAPLAAGLLWPRPAPTPGVERSIALSGPIIGFEQTADRLKVHLPSFNGTLHQIVINGPDKQEMVVNVGAGLRWVSVKLPEDLAAASWLDVKLRKPE